MTALCFGGTPSYRMFGLVAALAVISATARAQPPPATQAEPPPATQAEPPPATQSQPTAHSRLQNLESPMLLEKLSEKLWALEDDTTAGWRAVVAANLVYGLAWREDVRVHQLLGPALAARILPYRTASKPDTLKRRLDLLKRSHVVRLESLLRQECTKLRNEITEVGKALQRTQQELDQKHKKNIPKFKDVSQDEPLVGECVAPDPLPLPSPAPKESASLDAANRETRQQFLREVQDDLIRRLNTAMLDLEFLLQTARAAASALSRADTVVEEAQPTWCPFAEVLVGYTFQISETGFGGQELGGPTLGAGVGFSPRGIPTFSLGVMLVQPATWGGYVSASIALTE
jgi:hypothetical protein